MITIVAVVSAGRRDVGAALLSQREGRATGGTWLSSPLSLAWKVDRGLIYVWIGALTGLAVVVGILTKAATTLLNSSQQLQHLIERLGGEGNFANSYAASLIGAMSLATTAFAITLMLRIHDDEIHGRTELVLSTDVSRRRLLTARVVTAALSTLSIQVALGLAVGISYTVAADAGWAPVGNYLGVALLYTTAIWFMGAVALLLAAAIPRVVWIAWATFAYVVAMGELGSLLDLPTWMQATTPFWFVPRWPLEDFNVIPVMILILLSAMLVLGGYVGLRRRDIPA